MFSNQCRLIGQLLCACVCVFCDTTLFALANDTNNLEISLYY